MSPHLYDYRERIQLASSFFDDDLYREGIQSILSFLKEEKIPLHFFDTLFLLASHLFEKSGCDYAVIEAGVGGGLDSTNVISPELSLITSIELEHTQILGNTLVEIAEEKAGIIKRGVPTVTVKQSGEVFEIFEERARERVAPLKIVDELWKFQVTEKLGEGDTLTFKEEKTFHANLSNGSPAQLENLCLALAGYSLLFPSNALSDDLADDLIDDLVDDWERELSALDGFVLAGRFERIEKGGVTHFLDVSHTPASVENTIQQFLFFEERAPVVLFSCKNDKEAPLLLSLLWRRLPSEKSIIITEYERGSAYPIEKIREVLARDYPQISISSNSSNLLFVEDVLEAYREGLRLAAAEDRPLLLLGSFYLFSKLPLGDF